MHFTHKEIKVLPGGHSLAIDGFPGMRQVLGSILNSKRTGQRKDTGKERENNGEKKKEDLGEEG